MALKDTAVEFEINIKDNVTGEFRSMKASVNGFTDAVQKGNKAVKESTGVFGKLTDRLIKVRTTFDALESVTRTFKDLAAPAVEFQQGLADLSAITGVVGENLDTVANMAKRIGAESGLGASKAARAFTLLASNIQVPINQYEELLDKSAMLSHATGMSIDDAAASLASTVNQFGLATSEAGRVINVLAAGSKYGAAEVVDLAQSFKVTGATASALGLDVESTAGALEVLSKAGVKGAEAGTKLRNVMLNLATKMGVDFKVTSLSTALDALRPRLEDTEFLAKTFGIANVASAQFLIQNADAVAQMTEQVSGTATAFEQAEIRNSTWQHSMEVMAAKLEGMKIGLGNLFGPMSQYMSAAGGALAVLGPTIQGFATLQSGLVWTKTKYQALGIAQKVSTVATKAWAAVQGVASVAASAVSARLATMRAAIMRTAVAQKVAAVATKVWAGVQAAFNVIASLNPIGLIVMGITALVAAIAACIKWFDSWGETVLNCMGPIGWAIASVVRHWESLKKAFTDGGILAGLKRIGVVLLDALLLPVQKLLELLSRVPGMGKLAEGGAQRIAALRERLDLIPAAAKPSIAQQASIGTNAKLEQAVNGGSRGLLADGDTGAMPAAQRSTEAVATGGQRNTSINISLKSLVESMTFEGTAAQNAEQVERDMAQTLLRVLNMAASAAI